MKKNGKLKHVLYLIIALAMLLYALPHISFSQGSGWVSAFGIVWALFALMVIGAHLHFLLGVDEEKRRALQEIRQAKYDNWELNWPKERSNNSEGA